MQIFADPDPDPQHWAEPQCDAAPQFQNQNLENILCWNFDFDNWNSDIENGIPKSILEFQSQNWSSEVEIGITKSKLNPKSEFGFRHWNQNPILKSNF
jgi:hypothetical protein